MAYTETTSKNWFQRLGEAFKGILIGFVIIALATWLLRRQNFQDCWSNW